MHTYTVRVCLSMEWRMRKRKIERGRIKKKLWTKMYTWPTECRSRVLANFVCFGDFFVLLLLSSVLCKLIISHGMLSTSKAYRSVFSFFGRLLKMDFSVSVANHDDNYTWKHIINITVNIQFFLSYRTHQINSVGEAKFTSLCASSHQ